MIINKKEHNSAFTFIIACNTKHVGKGMYMAPKANVGDGLLDLVVVKGNLSRMLFPGSEKVPQISLVEARYFNRFFCQH